MGLDTCVYELIDPKGLDLKTKSLRNRLERNFGYQFKELEESDLPCFKGFERFIVDVREMVFDEERMFLKRELDFRDYEPVISGDDYSYAKKEVMREREEVLKLSGDENDIVWEDYGEEEVFKKEEVLWKWAIVKYIVLGREIGYQRRGENKKFHDDGKWDSNIFVLRKESLLKDWNDYFSDTDDYGHTPEESRARFKENILDKFVEGKTVVIYQ